MDSTFMGMYFHTYSTPIPPILFLVIPWNEGLRGEFEEKIYILIFLLQLSKQ